MATPKQRAFLWRSTQRSWYPQDLAKEIDVAEATKLVGAILDHFKGESDDVSKLFIKSTVEEHTGKAFELDELVNRPPKKARNKRTRKGAVERHCGPKKEPKEPNVTITGGSDPNKMTLQELLESAKELERLRERIEELTALHGNQSATIEQLCEKEKELLAKIEELEKKPSLAVYEPKDPEYIKPKDYDKIVHILKTIGQVRLRGPAGCGKTLLAKKIGEELERDVYIHSCSGGPALENVIGSTELVTDPDGNQITSFQVALPLEHMMQDNTLTVMDETPALEPESAMGLNGLLERNTREVSTKDGPKQRSKDNWIICTGNTNGLTEDRKYIGAQLQDGSNVDRTPVVNMDYEWEVESGILDALGVNNDDRIKMLDRMDHMRRVCSQLQIPFDPSTRRLVTCAELYMSGMDLDDAFEVALTGDVEERQRREVVNW